MQKDALNQTVGGYWDERSRGYAMQVDQQETEDAFSRYRPFLDGLKPGSKVLDVGCGPGFFATQLALEGFAVTAVDLSVGMLEETQKRAADKGVSIATLQADAANLPFADGTFDLVCCRDLVWNLPEPESAYKEWLRVLAPGGSIVIFDGNHYRYLFDERYARVHEAWEMTSGHILLGVKTDVIDAVAKTLPLGKESRPQWDEETFKRLGAAQIQSQTLSTFEDPLTHETLIAKFVVQVRKTEV